MFDDEATRQALRSLTDEPAPPVTTTLDEVVRRGRRRVRAQRVNAVVGVVGVVVAVGVGAVSVPRDGGVAAGGTVTTSLPGWEVVDLSGRDCTTPETPLPEPEVPLPSGEALVTAIMNAVEVNDRHEPVLGASRLLPDNGAPGTPRTWVSVTVHVAGGDGQLFLEAGRHGGTPLQAAEETIGEFGTCASVQRRTLADGTVLQLFPVNDATSPGPAQSVQIYLPGGLEYIVTSAGFGQDEGGPFAFRSRGEEPGGTGRGALPVTEAQLAAIAERLATALG